MCKWNGEAIDHLLLHCPIARELWNIVCSLFEVHWVMLHGVVEVELLASWSDNFNRHKSSVVWSMIHHCLIWGIWREKLPRNFIPMNNIGKTESMYHVWEVKINNSKNYQANQNHCHYYKK